MPTPTSAPISLFGGNLTITPKPAATTQTAVSASPFSVASLTAAAPSIRSEPPPPAAQTPATLDTMAPVPQKVEQVATPEIKKEVVSEPVLSEESFASASSAVLKLFSDELNSSLRQSLDATYTVHTHNSLKN